MMSIQMLISTLYCHLAIMSRGWLISIIRNMSIAIVALIPASYSSNVALCEVSFGHAHPNRSALNDFVTNLFLISGTDLIFAL